MRPDFNKLLTEAPRLGDGSKFSDVRNTKGNKFDEDEVGGKRSIHSARRKTYVPRRQFNENLNTLRRFIQTNVGRPWNKVYSEICANFDKRKVINDHILTHLFEYVELECKMHNGVLSILKPYRDYGVKEEGFYEKRWEAVKDSSTEWYVDPRDGILKYNKRRTTRKQQAKVRERQSREDKARIFRLLNDTEELHLIDGIWFLYTLKRIPKPVKVFGYQNFRGAVIQLPEGDPAGGWHTVHPGMNEIADPPKYARNRYLYGRGAKREFYYAARQTASRKLLKAHGLDGTAVPAENEEAPYNHREFAALKKAA